MRHPAGGGCHVRAFVPEMYQPGERIVNLERLFNLSQGLTPKDNGLPDRMLKEPMPDGVAQGEIVDLDYMLERYYRLRG